MRNNLFRKVLIFGIIVSIIGAGVFPVLGIVNNNGNILIENQTQEESELQNDATLGDNDWPMFKHDLQNTGYSTSSAPQTNNIKWIYQITAGAGVESSPAVVNGRVYFGSATSWPDKFFCLNAETGELIWITDLPGGPSVGSPTVVDGKVYQGSTYDYVYCFDADTGDEIWSFYKGYGVCFSPSLSNNKVYIPFIKDNYKPKICCLDADTGTEIWNMTFADGEIGHVAIYEGKVYVSHIGGVLFCIDSETGGILWENYTGGTHGAPAIANGKVYASANGIRCFDSNTGEEFWHYQGSWSYCSPSVAYNKIYYVSSDGKILCLDADTGVEVWSYIIGSSYEHAFPSPAVADGKVYVGIWSNGKLFCLDAYSGEFIWDYLTASPEWFFNSPAVVDGRLYIGGGLTNKIYCFEDPSRPPEPPIIDGPIEGKLGFEYEFRFMSTDPECEDINYYIDWGDGTNSGWIGPYQSGEEIKISHTWSETGTFIIRARSEDLYGIKSYWSEHIITVIDEPALEIQLIKGGLFRVSTVIMNIGSKDATDINYSFTVDDGFILHGRNSYGNIDYIPVGGGAPINSGIILGFGSIAVYVNVTVPVGFLDTRKQNGYIVGFFIWVRAGGHS
jgi:outer membrane protein assembly factor BamB